MRLTVPVPKIELYKDGFKEAGDLLGRSKTGQHLSALVERFDEPLVISIDGAWGSGKSFFLQCWVGEHSKDGSHAAKTVYFDAFQHDYFDEPLIALTKAVCDRLPTDKKGREFLRSTRRIVAKVAMPAARVSGALATAGATEVTGILADAAIKSGWRETERATEEFWRKQTAKAGAMEQFRSALEEWTQPAENSATQNKLVIVVDELDRCRPDYALSLLEIAKHFFSVPGVHFVLGVNMVQLENSVRARYGNGVDAATYLQKFITTKVHLPLAIDRDTAPSWQDYFDETAMAMGFDEEFRGLLSSAKGWMARLNENRQHSLRSVDRVLPILALAAVKLGSTHVVTQQIVAMLAVMKALRPPEYSAILNNIDAEEKVRGAFSIRPNFAHFEAQDDQAMLVEYLFREKDFIKQVRREFEDSTYDIERGLGPIKPYHLALVIFAERYIEAAALTAPET